MDSPADPDVRFRATHPSEATGTALVAVNGSLNGASSNGHAVHGLRSTRVLVLNASYEPINVCTVRRAAVLVLKERAELLEHGEGALHSERMVMERPCVIRLMRYVRIPRDVHRRKITRKAVLARDAYTCQYCGRQHRRGGAGGEPAWGAVGGARSRLGRRSLRLRRAP